MTENEYYSIQVFGDEVIFKGWFTSHDAEELINFYAQRGYCYLISPYVDDQTFRLVKELPHEPK